MRTGDPWPSVQLPTRSLSRAVDADRVRDIGGGDDSRIQGGQQHVSEATPAP
ncbi:hypothetical protein J113_08365 [Mycobacterium tuberculosis CAS/NITR204]|uniref:Uncharacterized protein n=1 Tax=Mycobacterium tuberculosis CAS/NITR204 TaxID=1310114 RepID=R4M773_MYCTX|nr:hypothetical protein J113_08365 [Mycobacterium tuberculosis CAS/NITR204]